MRGINVFENGFANGNLEVTIVSIETANADFQILAQLFTVVSLCEHGNIPEVERNRVRPVVTHSANQLAVAESVVSTELDFADLNLGAFLDLENENDGVAGGDAFVLRGDFRELAAVLAQQFLQHDFRFLDFGGIELAFDAEADFAFLEAIENVRFGNGVDAVVADAADLRALFHIKNNDLTARGVWGVFDAEFHIFEELRVPQSLKIAAQRFFVVYVTLAAEDARAQRVATHAA